jgi:hypothetical protein
MLQSRGSLEELLDDLNVCEDEAYLPIREIESLRQEGWRVHKLIDDLEELCGDRFNPSSLQPFNE